MLAAVPSLNVWLDIELGLSKLLSIYCCKILSNENFAFAFRSGERRFVDEAPRQFEKEWTDALLKISGWQTHREGVRSLFSFPKEYKPVCY